MVPVLEEEPNTDPRARVRTSELRKAVKAARHTKWWLSGGFVALLALGFQGAQYVVARLDRSSEVATTKAMNVAVEAKEEVQAVKAEVREVKAEQRETRADVRDLYKAVQRGQRSSRLEQPLPPEEP
jgi:hypothetical protein